MNLTYSQLLKNNRNFRNLFWGQLVSELGSWFNFVAGLGVVRVISNASPEAAGLLLFWRTLPFAVLMPFAGAVADRFSRRSLMFWTDIARGVFALVFLFVTRPEDLWIAYIGSIIWIIEPIRGLGRIIVNMSEGLVSYDRVAKILREDREFPERP